MLRFRVTTLVCSAVGLVSYSAFADKSVTDRLSHLEQRIHQQDEEIQALKATPLAKVTFKQETPFLHQKTQPTITSSDGKSSIWPILLAQGDWASYSKSQPLSMPGIDNLKSSGENIRRAWIGFQGIICTDFGYKIVMDFGGVNGNETAQSFAGANSLMTINDGGNSITPFTATTGSGANVQSAWISYTGLLAPFTFRIGVMSTPANLNDTTHPADLLFNERPTPALLSRDLDAGEGRESVGFIGNGKVWNASLFYTGDTYGKGAFIAPATGSGGAQQGLVGRLVVAPWQCPATYLNVHLGGNFGYVFRPQEFTNTQNPGFTTFNIQFADRPELRVDNVTFVNTGPIDAQSAYSTGLELALSYGPVMIQGESFWYGISRNNPGTPVDGITNPKFSGWYVEGSWTLLGEPRRYNIATGSYTRPSPTKSFNPCCKDWGAWEIVGRYSSTDLDYDLNSTSKYKYKEPGIGNNSITISDAIFGGVQHIWSTGINFYPNDVLKFMFAWQSVHLQNIGAINNNGNYHTFEIRTQISL